MSHVMNTYARLPVAFSRVRGAASIPGGANISTLFPALRSIPCAGHPKLVAAIADQASHNDSYLESGSVSGQEALADKLCALSGMAEVFFCNSGVGPAKLRSSWRVFMVTKRASRHRPWW